jgi:type VI secretion system secreted protein VgrG
VTYWFEHGPDHHSLVLGDSPDAYSPLAGEDSLPFRVDGGTFSEDEYVSRLGSMQKIQSDSFTLRDYDFARPQLDVTASTPRTSGNEVYDYPSGTIDLEETKRISRIRLEEQQVGLESWLGLGTCNRLLPGSTFTVTGLPDCESRLLAVRVRHQGIQQSGSGEAAQIEDSYRNEFEAIRSDRQFRPHRIASPPRIPGIQTATVVGPPSEEVFTDEYGRIKVQFHWDRKGKRDEKASAWVRTKQAWGGPGLGALFLPRVGQEVVLRFLEGNPDRPFVAGAVYNGSHPPPIDLPSSKTKSTLKSDSSPHSGGSNELRFEDAAGLEQVYLHGQRNETIGVLNDKTQKVHGAEQLRVDRDRHLVVEGEQLLRVAQDDSSRIQGNQSLSVQADRSVQIGGSHSESISATHSTRVSGTRDVSIHLASTDTVGAAAALTVGAAYEITVGGALNEAVGGLKASQVGGARFEVVGAHRQESVSGESLASIGADFESDLAGQLALSTGKDQTERIGATRIAARKPASWRSKKINVTADEFRLMVGGKVILLLTKDGRLQISGTKITVNGTVVSAHGAPLAKVGPGAATQARRDARTLAALRHARAIAKFRLIDQDGEPLPNEPFKALFSDGTFRTSATDAQGRGAIPAPLPGSFRLLLPLFDKIANPSDGSAGVSRKGAAPGSAHCYVSGKPPTLRTDTEQTVQARSFRMTLTFSAHDGDLAHSGYPVYRLESIDGEYQRSLSVRQAARGTAGAVLVFSHLHPGKKYRLSCQDAPDHNLTLFDAEDFDSIVDQDHAYQGSVFADVYRPTPGTPT